MAVTPALLARAARSASITLLATSALVSGCSTTAAPPAAPATNTAAPATALPGLEQVTSAIHGIDAAAYGYGVIGAYANPAGRKRSLRALAALQRQRLQFELALGQSVDEGAAAYALPIEVTDAATSKALAVLIESRLAAVLTATADSTLGAVHDISARAARKSAIRALQWEPGPVPVSSASG